ncbi:MAG TPA: hypothetical protein VFN44_00440, partial [Solirubrobacteraceae bacterium]|nr:hypothetical protein [Solirubrobacteraceae bacterium]
MALDGAGNTYVAYAYYNGSHYEIHYSVRGAGGSFSTPTRLSNAGRYAYGARVVANNAGDVLIAWYETNGSNYLIRAAFKPAGGSLGAAQDVSGSGQNAFSPSAAIAANGTAMVAWYRSNGTNDIIQAAMKPAGSGFFGSASDLSAAGQSAGGPEAAMNDAGDATVAWYRYDGATYRVQATTKPASGGFGAAQTLTPSGAGHAFTPRVAMTSNRRATAVWYRYSGTGYSGNASIQSAETDTNGNFQTVQDVTNPATSNSFVPSVDVDQDNNAV